MHLGLTDAALLAACCAEAGRRVADSGTYRYGGMPAFLVGGKEAHPSQASPKADAEFVADWAIREP